MPSTMADDGVFCAGIGVLPEDVAAVVFGITGEDVDVELEMRDVAATGVVVAGAKE